ncbi:sugar phosphate isomerase/epimerase family protein [Halalkalibacter hemicellulosilyticus]|nr:sugar phosphate isomerase/epimerase [Halalkalibacter hemicellulosilyticus]
MRFVFDRNQLKECDSIPPGIQLYSVRREFNANPVQTLQALSDMGYETVEFAGYGDVPASVMKQYLRDASLQAPASHVQFEHLVEDLQAEIEYAKVVGIAYIVIPFVEPDIFKEEAAFQQLIFSIKKMAKIVKEAGLQLAYHNHQEEFEPLPSGELVIDRLIREVGSDLVLEIDLYWTFKAGFEPLDVLTKYKGRTPLVHIKEAGPTGETTELDRGVIDYRLTLKQLERFGVYYYFVEQEHFERPPLKSAQINSQFVQKWKGRSR